MIRLSYHGWKIEFTYESFCWKRRKLITIGRKVKNKKQMILHEIAHIGTSRFCNQKHSFDFWKHFDDLMIRFLPHENICQMQIEHRKYASRGFYSLGYAN
ncbi:hypothetical protein ES703_116651 [subsurface metagenome]